MKKLLFLALLLPTLAFADMPITAHVVKQTIVAPAKGVSEPILIPIAGVLKSIKTCLSFDSPVKNVQLKSEIEDVWFGSVSQDCTTLEEVGPISIPEDSSLRLSCRNFDDVQRTCRVKVVYYTKE